MKLAHHCLKCSILLVKLNFSFILVLQLVKFLIHSESNESLLNYENNYLTRRHFVPNSTLKQLAPNENSIQTSLKNLFVSLSSWYSYDINELEAIKTEVVNLHDASKTNESQKPCVTIKSFINLTEMLKFNNLKKFTKIALVLNLNLTIMLINLLLVSYLIVKKRTYSFLKARFGKNFLKIQLITIMISILFILVLNLVYMCFVNKNFKNNTAFSNLNKTLLDYLNKLFNQYDDAKLSENSNSGNYILLEYKTNFSASTYDHTFNPESQIQDIHRYLALANIKLNIFFMVISVCLLVCYSSFIKIGEESKIKPVEGENEKALIKLNEYPILISEDEDDEDCESDMDLSSNSIKEEISVLIKNSSSVEENF